MSEDYGSKINHVNEYEFEGVKRAVVTYWNGVVESGSVEEFEEMGIYPFKVEPFSVRKVLSMLTEKDANIRAVQQQNKQLRDALRNIDTHIGNFTSTQFYHDAYIEVKQLSHKALQGGTSNGTS